MFWSDAGFPQIDMPFEEREQRSEVRRQELRHKIAEGLAQLDRGEGIPGEQVFAELDAELDALEKTRKTG
jgi:antitoxin ParD1/3/4